MEIKEYFYLSGLDRVLVLVQYGVTVRFRMTTGQLIWQNFWFRLTVLVVTEKRGRESVCV